MKRTRGPLAIANRPQQFDALARARFQVKTENLEGSTMERRLTIFNGAMVRKASRMLVSAGVMSMSIGAASTALAFDCSDGAIRLGLARAATGGFSFFDVSGANGMRIAVEEINKAGGVEGCRLEILSGDTQSNPALSGQIAEELIRAGAHIIVPSADMDLGIGASLAAQSANLLSISPEASSTDWVIAVKPHHFTNGLGVADLASSIAEFMNSREWANAYIVTNESFNFFKSKEAPFEATLEGNVVGRSGTNNEMSDFGSIVSQIREAGDSVDAIFINDYFPRAGTFLRQLRAAGVTLPVVGDSTFPSKSLQEIVGAQGLQDVYYVSSAYFEGDDASEAARNFAASYEATFDEFPPNANPITAYQATFVLTEALKRAGSTNAAALNEALLSIKDFEVAGTLHYDYANHFAQKSATVVGFDGDGNFVEVDRIDPRTLK